MKQKILKAGAAAVNITPLLGTSLVGYFRDRKATDVHDELYAKAVVLDNNETQLALVVCDIIGAGKERLGRARELIQERCGIPVDHTMISCTHTHTGPASVSALEVDIDEPYMEFLVPRIVDSVQRAKNRLQEARISFGLGRVDGVAFNRRYWMKDGTVRMNPGYHNPNIVRPAGPIDPELGVLRLVDLKGKTIALLANFALHYVGEGDNLAVSADYFGFFSQAIQRLLNERFIAMLANGCCGNVNNIDVHNPPTRKKPYEHAKHVATLVAAEALRVSELMTFSDWCLLAVNREILTIGVRQPTAQELEEAERLLAKPTTEFGRERVYAREILMLSRMEKEVQAEVQVIRMGDLALVALPGEVFVEIGLEIKKRSPFKTTFVVELANDWVGYVPTAQAFEEGDYETRLARSSKLAPEAAMQFTQSAVKLLHKLHDSGK